MMEITSEQIISFLEDHKREIGDFGVNKIGLFGSFARGEQTPESDIDFIVEYKEGEKSFDNFTGLVDYLENALNREVELVTTESMSPFIKPFIDKEIRYAQL